MNQQNLSLETETEPMSSGCLPGNTRSEAPTIDVANAVAERPGVEIVGQMLARYNAETLRHKRRSRRTIKAGGIVAALVTLLSAIAMPAAVQSGATSTVGLIALNLGLWAFITFVCAGVLGCSGVKRAVQRYYLMQAATKYDDVQAVGPLTEMFFEWPSTWVTLRRKIGAMLTALLSRLTPDDAHLLNAEQRQQLCGILCSGAREDHDLCVAILRAFAQVGDRSGLMQVERIADSPAGTWRRCELKAEAQRCLPLLLRRTEHEQASRTLLRPAGPSIPAAATLLRPAAANADSPLDHLLHSVETAS